MEKVLEGDHVKGRHKTETAGHWRDGGGVEGGGSQGFFNSTRIVCQTQPEPLSNIFLWFGKLHGVVGTDSLIHRSVYRKA